MHNRNLSAHPQTLPSGRVVGPGETADGLSETDADALDPTAVSDSADQESADQAPPASRRRSRTRQNTPPSGDSADDGTTNDEGQDA